MPRHKKSKDDGKRDPTSVDTKSKVWLTLLTSGLAVTVFGFFSDKIWQSVHHHTVGPKYVSSAMRIENETLLIFVRNDSEDPLDLIKAQIDIVDPELANPLLLGAYPDVTKVYEVSPTAGSAKLEFAENKLRVRILITQTIEPRHVDHFGFRLLGPGGPINLAKSTVHAEMKDVRGNIYRTDLSRGTYE